MKTLDPSDYNYRPNYNSSDSNDYHTAKGFNYHQGPVQKKKKKFLLSKEWVWPFGWFLRAKMIFAEDKHHALILKNQIQKHIKYHREHIASSPWAGLPELTNGNGEFCFFSYVASVRPRLTTKVPNSSMVFCDAT
jgi:glycogen debranching enzyme